MNWRIHVKSFPSCWNISSKEVILIQSSSILFLKLIQRFLIVLNLLRLLMILLLLFDEFLEHLFLMLSRYMIFENIFFHLLSTLRTLIHSLRAILQMQLHISLLYSQAAFLRTLNFKLINNLLQAHVRLESLGQINLTVWTFLGSQLAKTGFTNDCSTLSTIIRRFWKIKANYALQLLEA